MAEEAKTEYKAVEVSLDIEGNPVVKPIEEPKKDEDLDNQDDDSQNDDNDDNQDDSNDDNQDDDSGEDNDDNQDDDADADSDDDNQNDDSDSEEDDADDDDTNADSDDSDVHTQDDDVVDYDELPEAVQKYLDFFEETGGSLQDFAAVNRDFDSLPQDDVIREFMRKQNPYLDQDDIDYEMESRFGINEEDSDAEVRAKKVAKKKFYGEAMKTLKAEGEKYKADLGSSAALPQQAKEALEFKQSFEARQAEAAKQQKAVEARVNSFVSKSKKVLGKDFKGFEVKVGDDTYTYKPSNVTKTREENLNVNNLLGKFTDKEGNVTDVVGYHKALTFASNPDAVAAHFIEIGKAMQAEAETKGSKNIKQNPRQVHGKKDNSKAKFKFVDVDGSMSKNAKIKLRNY